MSIFFVCPTYSGKFLERISLFNIYSEVVIDRVLPLTTQNKSNYCSEEDGEAWRRWYTLLFVWNIALITKYEWKDEKAFYSVH